MTSSTWMSWKNFYFEDLPTVTIKLNENVNEILTITTESGDYVYFEQPDTNETIDYSYSIKTVNRRRK